MANPIYTIQNKPKYQWEIPAITTQTPAHAETVLRPLFESVINNTEYVRQRTEAVAGQLDEAIEGLTPEGIGAIPTAEKAAAGGVASLGSDGKVPVGQLPAMDYDAAGSAAAVRATFDTHTAAANPHSGSVPTGRKVNGKALTGDVTLTAGDVGAVAISSKGIAGGVATLDIDGIVQESQLPSILSGLEAKLTSMQNKLNDAARKYLYIGEATLSTSTDPGVFWTIKVDEATIQQIDGGQLRFRAPSNTRGSALVYCVIRPKTVTGNIIYMWDELRTVSGANLNTQNITAGSWITLTFSKETNRWRY